MGNAVVLGASIAGLLAARVLADAYDQVIVVERDPLPDGTTERKGVPQGRHAHVLLPVGAHIMDDLFPGILDDMTAAGVPAVTAPEHTWLDFDGHKMADNGGRPDDPGYHPSRPFLEALVRERVRALPTVTFRDGTTALGLTTTDDRHRVTGVRLDLETLPADLVVDATGRGGRTTTWLHELGYQAPAEETLPVDLMYTTQHLRLRPGALGPLLTCMVTAVPVRPTGMAFFAQENDRFVLTLGGYAGQHAPADREGFLAYTKTIAPPHVYEAIVEAEPLDDIRQHRYPASRRRYYEKLRRFPEGLLVIGDGICSFNPLYGQGMAVASLQAKALQKALRAGEDNLARRFFAAAAKPVDRAWQIVTTTDRALLGAPRPAVERLLSAYVAKVQAAAVDDPAVARQFFAVSFLAAPPTSLLKPSILRRALFG